MSLSRRYFRIFAASALLALSFAAGLGCQEVEQSQTVLTQKQWNEVKKHILDEEPDPKYKIGANYGDKIELIGFDVEEPIRAGDKTTFTWYWKALSDIDKNWKIFIHFDSEDPTVTQTARRQNLDHQPLDGKYLTSRWEKGKIIKDVHEVKLRENYPRGQAVPYIGFYRGKTRLAIKNPEKNHVRTTDDRRVIGPTLTIKEGPKSTEPPRTKEAAKDNGGDTPSFSVPMVGTDLAEAMQVDGKLEETFWTKVPSVSLTPFGSTPKLNTRVNVAVSGDYLLVGAKLEDTHAWGSLEKRDSKTWTEEVLELFIDVDGDSKNYLELQITPAGTIFDANFKQRLGRGEGSRDAQIDRAKKFNLEGLESAVHVEGTLNDDSDEDDFWSVEMKIPLKSIPGLDGPPKSGDSWAVNLYRFDKPNSEQRFAYAWSTKPRGDFHQVDKFGTWKFTAGNTDSVEIDPKVLENLKDFEPNSLDMKVPEGIEPGQK